ncbi:MAG: DUF4430 domain-containing protein [Lachnospiraceae bacterium]
MSEKRKTNKKILAGVLGLAVLALFLGALYLGFRPRGEVGSKEIAVTFIHEDLSEKSVAIKTNAAYLGDALMQENLIAGEAGEYGLYVTDADGEHADESKQEWWCFTKEGETLLTGADTTPIEDGDQFEITFTTGW